VFRPTWAIINELAVVRFFIFIGVNQSCLFGRQGKLLNNGPQKPKHVK